MESQIISYWQRSECQSKACSEKHMVQINFTLENTKVNKNDVVKKNDEVMPEKIQIQAYIPHEGEVNRVRHNPH